MKSLDVTPLHTRFVAQVHAAVPDLLDDEGSVEALRSLWQRYPVLIFRRQSLDEDEMVRFSECFGRCDTGVRKDIQSPYHPEIIYFSTLRYADGRYVGGFAGGEELDWHSDQTYQLRPATGAVLYGTEVPRDGGRMHWADQYAAYESLEPSVQALIDGRVGVHRYAKRYAKVNTTELKDKAKANAMLQLPDARHPVVLTHPQTGRKALYADPTTLVAIEGLSDEDNARVLPILFEAGAMPSAVYVHTVRNGDVMMWDNGCLMHRRDPIGLDQPRLMKRTTFRLPADAHCLPQA